MRCFHSRVGRKLRQTEDTIARDGTAQFQMISEQSVGCCRCGYLDLNGRIDQFDGDGNISPIDEAKNTKKLFYLNVTAK